MVARSSFELLPFAHFSARGSRNGSSVVVLYSEGSLSQVDLPRMRPPCEFFRYAITIQLAVASSASPLSTADGNSKELTFVISNARCKCTNEAGNI